MNLCPRQQSLKILPADIKALVQIVERGI